ncbi:MAG: hypothetical protein V9G11_08230 [Bifidobacterium adolescentis]
MPVPFSPVMRTLASDGPTRGDDLEHGPHGGGLGDEVGAALAAEELVFLLEAAVGAHGAG